METHSGKINKKKVVLFSIILGCVAAIAVAAHAYALYLKTVVDIELFKSSIELVIGESTYVSYSIEPDTAKDAEATWESSDDSIAIVNSYGKIIGIGEGSCKIMVTAGEKTDSLKVTVKEEVPDFKEIFDVCDLDASWATVASDESYLLIDTNPDNINDYVEHAAYFSLSKIHKYLGLPEYLIEEMGRTTVADGLQNATFEDINLAISWKYNSSVGLEVMYKVDE